VSKVVLHLGDDVSTDVIYPGRFMATVLPAETRHFAFADLPGFHARLVAGEVPRGGVIVAGRNFGCGSSREQAVSCLAGHELVVVARGFARIFLHNAVNLGLVVVVAPGIEAAEGDDLELTPGEVLNTTTGRRFPVVALPRARQAIVEAGGLVAYTRRRIAGAVAGKEVSP
jgi:3-isopropylmalate/(R)-2-methylmalate dehydratase small subunit